MPFVMITDVKPEPVEWLVPGWLARGHLHMLDGNPGLGKSLVLLDLVARLTTGRPFADGSAAMPQGSVVLLNAEDGAGDTVVPRLRAAGADMSRVAHFRRDPGERGFRFPSQVELLADIVQRQQASLVLLDPPLAFLDASVNIGSDPLVRQALAPLTDLAAARRCALVLLRHLNKQRSGRALYRGLASIAFTAACRVGWLIGPDPKVPRQYVLTQAKNNLHAGPPSLAYRITGASHEAARIEWLGPSVWSSSDLLRTDPARLQLRQPAREFVEGFLKDGPQPVRTVLAAARAQGLSKRTTERAVKDAAIVHQRIVAANRAQTTYWVLPGQQMPAHLVPPGWIDLEPYFRRMEQDFAAPPGAGTRAEE